MFYALLVGTETAYNVADAAGLIAIRDLAALFTQVRPERGLRLIFSNADDERVYNKSPGQGLDSTRLTGLGWQPAVPLPAGLDRMVTALEFDRDHLGSR
jgi:UDP-glucuronate decarboxylase